MKACKRGHILNNNRYVVSTKHKKSGKESGCRRCKNMRNNLQRLREELKLINKEEQIPTLEEFAKEFFKGEFK